MLVILFLYKEMIFEEATKEAFSYYPSELTLQSGKLILAACETCGEFKLTTKNHYYTFCISCSMKGKTASDKTKAKLRLIQKGKKFTDEHKTNISGALKGKFVTKETKVLMSKNHADFKGEKHPRWNGGKKIRKTRANAKHYRELGYTILLPLGEGEVGHHVTDEYVIGIPKSVHEKLSGGGREKHRSKILEWLETNDIEKCKIAFNALNKVS